MSSIEAMNAVNLKLAKETADEMLALLTKVWEQGYEAGAKEAAIKAAQPPEYPSAADDEATRFRHGEPRHTSLDVIDDRTAIEQLPRQQPSAISDERPGWVSVPREPTDAMIFAAGEAWENSTGGLAKAWRDVYVGMLAAAPSK